MIRGVDYVIYGVGDVIDGVGTDFCVELEL